MRGIVPRSLVAYARRMRWDLFRRLGLRGLLLVVFLSLAGAGACVIKTGPGHRHGRVIRDKPHGHHEHRKPKKHKKYKKHKKHRKHKRYD